jgi:heme/copper-type cytochrome/quinol oxidase subunit 2
MLLNIYIGTIIFTIICFVGCMYGVGRELKVKYTKEQLIEVKKKYKKSGNPITNILLFICPVINIIFALIFTFGYNSMRDGVFKKYDEVLGIYKEPTWNDVLNKLKTR